VVTSTRRARADELSWVNDVYRRADFVASDVHDVVLVAEEGGARVGVGRLVPVAEDAYELGGMWVDEAARGRGVAKQLVAALLREAGDATLWCIPFARVADLYRGFGFADASADAQPPPAVVAKLAFCRARYPFAVVLLRR
jgi:N-acetylglutamate synthase-like GNAT family acetyltransferase